jgi:hypothetical protein
MVPLGNASLDFLLSMEEKRKKRLARKPADKVFKPVSGFSSNFLPVEYSKRKNIETEGGRRILFFLPPI